MIEEKNSSSETVEPVTKELTQIEKLNCMRKEFRNADIIWKSITSLVIVMAFVYIYFAYMKMAFGDGMLRIILAIVLLVAIPFCLYILPMLLRMSTKFKVYNTEYKNNFLQERIHQEFPKADYKSDDRISIKEISECSMIKKARSVNANDCIEGTYKGVDFLRYDMELSYKKGRQTSDCVLIVCNNRTQIDSEIQIIDKDFRIGKSVYEKPEVYSEYLSQDEEFDKEFTVYAQDVDAAIGFVNKELRKKLSKFPAGGPIATFFDRKKVYLIIRRKKDSMEAPVYKKVRDNACKREAEKEMDVIKKWVELLDDCVVK